ncbi:LuxR C-terminal-related transcriptional regulator [Novosphingobium sp. G106]|nr:LuxR C-terminal-related transcriptional regulator [Novosphingobium sp. G106]
MGGGLWDYDVEADSLYCNDRWYEIMGLCPERDPVISISDLSKHIHEEDVEAATEVNLEQVSELLSRDQRYHVEFRIIRPDGNVRWLRSVACIIRDDAGHLRAVGCVIDITEFRMLSAESPGWAAGDLANAAVPAGKEDLLSERERECLRWVSMGKTAWETASILGRSQRTVEYHLKNAIRKLGATNKVHACALAIRLSLL